MKSDVISCDPKSVLKTLPVGCVLFASALVGDVMDVHVEFVTSLPLIAPQRNRGRDPVHQQESVTARLERTGTVTFLLSHVLPCFSALQARSPWNSVPFPHLPAPACALGLSSDTTHHLLLEAFADASRLALQLPECTQDSWGYL